MTDGEREEYVLRPHGGPPRIDYERDLNPGQLAVATAGGGPLLVIAGAGSGKTRTLVYRVAHLVESGVPPGAILLLTFTNKAAREMLHRAEGLLGEAVSVVGGTFHHAGHAALRRHGHAVGLPRGFTIADRDDASELIGDVATSITGKTDKGFPKGDVLLDMVSMSANTGWPIVEVLARKYPAHEDLTDLIMRIADGYAAKKKDLGLVDFDDLLTLWLRALRQDEDVRREFQTRFAYVLVDEYQDTNILQSSIVDLISEKHRNLLAVGDDAQSVYSFRGANFANIIRFSERYPDAKVFKLEQNYRSSPEILELANASIAHNTVQHPKKLFSDQPSGPKPRLVPLARPDEQAQYVTQRISELEEQGVPMDEIAVLYRSHWLSMELQMELTRRGIAFEVRSGVRFFEQAHIKDSAAYLRIAVNPKDEPAWKRVLRLLPGVGKVTAEKIWGAVAAAMDPVAELIRGKIKAPKAAAAPLADLARSLATVRTQKDRPMAQIEAVLACGYEQHLNDTYENAQTRLQDLRMLAEYARRYSTTDQFLAELALMAGATEAASAESGPPEKKIVLSTIHQAKGLEWTAVFVIGLTDGRFPDQRALGEGGEEEERRLFYVAVTRARRHLDLCFPMTAREGAFAGVMQRPSRFLQEVPAHMVTLIQVASPGRFGGGGGGMRREADMEDPDRWMDGDSPYDE